MPDFGGGCSTFHSSGMQWSVLQEKTLSQGLSLEAARSAFAVAAGEGTWV